MDDCIFCKIIASKLPSYKVYEDEGFIAILDRFPSGRGHVLVIPKKHIRDIHELDSETAGDIFKLTARLAKALSNCVEMQGMNILQNNGAAAGQSVVHFHIHLIPRTEGDNIKLGWKNTNPTDEEFKRIADSLIKQLA